ncbi:MAG: hypothetical protein L6Q92_09805 [Phycisphaerae bacterium]|nr:hypothetical protein [Phycisphaerae bacterium]
MKGLKRKVLVLAASVGLFGAAFQPAGCSFTVDQQLLQFAADWLAQHADEFNFAGGFHFSGHGSDHDEMDHDAEDDGSV